MTTPLILMGVIGKPHGVRGQMRVHAFGEDPARLAGITLSDAQGREFAVDWAHDNVAWVSEVKNGARRRITDRNEAAGLTNLELFMPRSALPDPEEDEFYLTDLIGLNARTEAGVVVGVVANVLDYGAGASLELAPGGQLIPFNRVCVPHVEVKAGYVVVNPPEEIDAKEVQA